MGDRIPDWAIDHTQNNESYMPTKTQPKLTHADKLRASTDDEIESWYWWMHEQMMSYTDSRAFVHDWLKQEAHDA